MSIPTMNQKRSSRRWRLGVDGDLKPISVQAEIQPLPLEDIYRVVA